MKIKANKKEDAPTNFAPSEREARIQQQKDRLSGLRFRGKEECAHCSYDIALTMLERDTLVYLGPEKFPTRRNELQLKKPGKEITIDQSQLILKEKPADFTCSTNTELEVANALRRRALAFDLVGICSYDIMTSYHADLLDHLHTPPPPGYSPISIQQILRADRAAFIFLAERMTSLKRDATNRIPMDLALPNVIGQPTVAFHLLPLAGAAAKAASTKEKPSGTKKRPRSPARQSKAGTKGGAKGKKGKQRGRNIPAGLINKALETLQKQRICWGKLFQRPTRLCRTRVLPAPFVARAPLRER